MNWGTVWDGMITTAAAVIIGSGLICLVMIIRSSGAADFCYTRGDRDKIVLWAHVPWGNDRHHGEFQNTDAAVEAAHRIGCRVAP